MLGGTTLQNWYASQDTIQVRPKVVAEWNANALTQPYVYGDGDGSFHEITAITGLTSSTGFLGGASRKFTMPVPYTTTAVATEKVFGQVVTPKSSKSYRLSFFGSADKVTSLTVIATAKTSSTGTILEQSSTTITLSPATQMPFIVDCISYNENSQIGYMEYTLSTINSTYSGESINVVIDSPRIYTVNQYEILTGKYLSLADVFAINRPGEAYLQGSSAVSKVGNGNVSPYNIAWQKLLKKNDASSSWDSIRNFVASINAPFKYYLYSDNTTKEIFARYANVTPVNKLILKVNSKQTVPSAVNIYTLSTKDGNFSGTPDATISSAFDSNGLAQLYWNGTTWTTTPWTSIPTYADQTISLSKNIYGVKVELTSSAGEVHLVEISPRLELDLSSYVINFSVTNELSNDSLPTPIGVSNSDTASVTLENLPVYIGGQYIQPFDNYTGPLRDLLKKNVSVRIIVQTYIEGLWVEQQIAKMTTSSWSNDGIESCTVEMFDSIKTLSQIQCPSIYKSAANIGIMVSTILDSVGFTDYNYDSLMEISTKYLGSALVENYWTVTQENSSVLEALQALLLPYQISMSVDECGILTFKHLKQIIQSTPESTYKVTSIDSGGVKSNIIDFSVTEENAPSRATVEYTNISPSYFTDLYLGIRRAGAGPIDGVFAKEVLGYLKLASSLQPSDRSMEVYISKNSMIDSHSGYLLLDSEIIKFDGIEYTFVVAYSNQPAQVVKRIVKNKTEIDSIRAEYLSSQNVIGISEQTGTTSKRVLRNLTRGCFGTRAEAHIVGADVSDFTGTAGLISSNSNNIVLNKIDGVANYKTKCEDSHRLFSGTFVISESAIIPTSGKTVEFGIQVGASSGNQNAVRVGLTFYKKAKDASTTVYTYGIAVKQYNGSGTLIPTATKNYTLESYEVDKKGNAKTTFNHMINTHGENSIVALFMPDSDGTSRKMSIMVNGNIIKFSDNEASVELTSGLNSELQKIEIPAINLVSAPSFSGTNLSAYSNGILPVNLVELQAFKVPNNSDADQTKKILNILATIMHGNLLGLSNKDELESVVAGRKIAPLTENMGYVSKSIAREIKEINADFTQSTFPVLYSYIVRSPYKYEYTTEINGKKMIETSTVPGDSITFSRIDHTPTSARFAMINSYSSPVYINANNNSSYSSVENITQLYGAVLEKTSTTKLTAKINDDNSDAEVSITSDWIQNEDAASKILSSIVSAAIMKRNSIEVTVFGNPLIMVGDILNVEHHLKNFSGRYAVMSVTKDFENGINTSVTLRRVSA